MSAHIAASSKDWKIGAYSIGQSNVEKICCLSMKEKGKD